MLTMPHFLRSILNRLNAIETAINGKHLYAGQRKILTGGIIDASDIASRIPQICIIGRDTSNGAILVGWYRNDLNVFVLQAISGSIVVGDAFSFSFVY